MQKKNYLTFQEQKLYEVIKDTKTPFFTNDICEMFPELEKQRINRLLKSLKDKKYINQLRKGIYTSNQLKTNLEIFKTALSIYPGYISHLSALRYYDLIDYEPTTIFISTTNRSKELTNGSFIFKYINQKNYSDYISKEGIFVSTLEKTIFDCLYKPQFSGNYSVITKAIYDSCNQINWNYLKEIYNKSASNRQFQITGYILELLKKKTNSNIPKTVIDFFKSKKKSKVKLINNNNKSIYIKEWLLQDNLGEKEILSWWF